MLIFFIFRAEAYTCWSARFARSRVGGVEFGFFIFKPFWFFFYQISAFYHFFSIFESLAPSEIEKVASKHKKNVVFGHFIKIRLLIIFTLF